MDQPDIFIDLNIGRVGSGGDRVRENQCFICRKQSKNYKVHQVKRLKPWKKCKNKLILCKSCLEEFQRFNHELLQSTTVHVVHGMKTKAITPIIL